MIKACAEQIFIDLQTLKGPWVHCESEFLPANVTTDFHGEMKFKEFLRGSIAKVLGNRL